MTAFLYMCNMCGVAHVRVGSKKQKTVLLAMTKVEVEEVHSLPTLPVGSREIRHHCKTRSQSTEDRYQDSHLIPDTSCPDCLCELRHVFGHDLANIHHELSHGHAAFDLQA